MTMVLIFLHVFICLALIGLVLIQKGRGAGLVESFSGVESMFGTKTNVFLTRATSILSTLFFVTCLSLALVSLKQSKSLMGNVKKAPAATTQPAEAPAAATPAAPASAPVSQTQPATQPAQNAPKAQ
jgi:preprotein translocase subunit SecG